jgi:ABC-type transport system involved in cytochrome bd biosynthesis fused ATPase/permease subunit
LLARALYKKSNVLIIDELLSNIGLDEENNILESIIKEYNDRILIYTSHRDINMNLFNKILYLKEKEG